MIRAVALALIAASSAAMAQHDLLASIVAGDAEGGEDFGWSMAVHGDRAVVCARLDQNNMGGQGSVYLFDIADPRRPVLIHKLAPAGNVLGFGGRIDIDASHIVIGADSTALFEGAAFVYSADDGALITELTPDEPLEVGDFFGYAVAVHEGVAVVTAIGDDEQGEDVGAAYVFDAATGEQLFKLMPQDDDAVVNLVGTAAALHGDLALVSALMVQPDPGAVYLFNVATGEQVGKLTPPDGTESDGFGFSLDIDGGRALVGAHRATAAPTFGSVHLFETPGGVHLFKTTAEITNDAFGAAVAMHGDRAVVGAPAADPDKIENAGAAYVIDLDTGEILTTLTAPAPVEDDAAGVSVAINEHALFVGVRERDDEAEDAGACFVFGCAADVNGDGSLNIFDFVAFQNAWAAGHESADCDGDGDLSIVDFVCFQSLFQAGCG